jgi:putative acyl-CoA dehydrogenase
MEVLGGNGYTEELALARIVREMPVNSIWEGSGNVMCLDVLRAFSRSPETREAVLAELGRSRGLDAGFDAAFERFAALGAASPDEAGARHFSQLFATLAQGHVLLGAAAGPAARAVAEGFCRTRLDPAGGWGAVFGAGARCFDARAILERAWTE